MGLWHASQGSVRFGDKDITALRTPQIAELGIAYVPENMGIFSDLTVKENMLLAARKAKNAERMDDARLKWIFQLFPAVEKFWNHPAGKLSGGQKQMLAVSRAIVEPRELLIIDEPSKGLAPAIINNMIDAFGELKAQRRDDPAGRAEHQLRAAPGRQRGRDGQRPRGAQRQHGRVLGRRTTAAIAAGTRAMKKSDFDWKPLLLVPVLALVALPLTGSVSTWLTLTVAGLAMGMIIFIIASGLTLIFGLMDVLNFGHGVFIALGAFVASSVLGLMGDWTGSGELWRNLVAVFPAMLVAMGVAGAVGLAFERFIVRPVYGQHLKQILITMGGMIIGEELIKVIWGRRRSCCRCPEALRGSLLRRRRGDQQVPPAGGG